MAAPSEVTQNNTDLSEMKQMQLMLANQMQMMQDMFENKLKKMKQKNKKLVSDAIEQHLKSGINSSTGFVQS